MDIDLIKTGTRSGANTAVGGRAIPPPASPDEGEQSERPRPTKRPRRCGRGSEHGRGGGGGGGRRRAAADASGPAGGDIEPPRKKKRKDVAEFGDIEVPISAPVRPYLPAPPHDDCECSRRTRADSHATMSLALPQLRVVGGDVFAAASKAASAGAVGKQRGGTAAGLAEGDGVLCPGVEVQQIWPPVADGSRRRSSKGIPSGGYNRPTDYIRFAQPTAAEADALIEYEADEADEAWLAAAQTKTAGSPGGKAEKLRLSVAVLELVVDRLEKAQVSCYLSHCS